MIRKILSTFCIIFITTIILAFPLKANAQDAESGTVECTEQGDCGLHNPEKVNIYYDLTKPPNQSMTLEIPNPGNLPFIQDKRYANMDTSTGKYGTIKNEGAYLAFSKVIEFAIKTLIKLVGVMSLFGVTEGLIRLVVAHGDEEIHKKGITMIFWSIIGLFLSLIAHAFVTALMQFVMGIGDLNI